MSKESRADRIVEYDDGKLWFHKKAGGIVILGVTPDAIDEIGEARSVEVPETGDDFEKDDVVCELRGPNGIVKVYAPAAGFVKDINASLSNDVMIVNEDPIDEGWLVKLEIQDDSDLTEFY